MGTISKPNNFSANTTISSSAVNANFDEIYDEFNGNISAANLAADSVTTAKIADDAITGDKIADATVAPANLTNPYKFRVRRTAAQNTSGGNYVKVNFDTEDFDTNSNFDSTTNYRYTVPVNGYYQINGYVNLGANGGTFVLAALYKNGTVYQRGDQINSTGACGVSYCDLIQLTAGDYIELFIFASNTVALDVGTGQQAYFSGYLVSTT